MKKGRYKALSANSNKMIDLLINNTNMDDFLISNGKIKKFCPFAFFNKDTDTNIKIETEVAKNGRH